MTEEVKKISRVVTDEAFLDYRISVTETLQSIQETHIAILELILAKDGSSKELVGKVTEGLQATATLIRAEVETVRMLVDYEAPDE